MSGTGPAMLTGALVARKGDASPAGYHSMPVSDRIIAAGPHATRHKASCAKPGSAAGSRGNRHKSMRVAGTESRVRISLRLDSDRHLRLRLAAAHSGSSLQDTLTAALDAYLDHIRSEVLDGKCACIAPRSGSNPDRVKI